MFNDYQNHSNPSTVYYNGIKKDDLVERQNEYNHSFKNKWSEASASYSHARSFNMQLPVQPISQNYQNYSSSHYSYHASQAHVPNHNSYDYVSNYNQSVPSLKSSSNNNYYFNQNHLQTMLPSPPSQEVTNNYLDYTNRGTYYSNYNKAPVTSTTSDVTLNQSVSKINIETSIDSPSSVDTNSISDLNSEPPLTEISIDDLLLCYPEVFDDNCTNMESDSIDQNDDLQVYCIQNSNQKSLSSNS